MRTIKAKRFFVLALTVILAATALAACSSGNYRSEASASQTPMAAPAATANSAQVFGESKMAMDDAVEYEEAYDMAEAPMETGGGDSGGLVGGGPITPVLDTRKIIKNVNMQLQTLTFDSGVSEISNAAESYGGYVQDSYIEGRDMYNTRGTRTATFTLRIPSEQLDAFTNVLGGQFNVISKSENKQDITDSYYDSKARLDALKIEEQALLAMLEGSPELEYMLEIRKELMNVRYEIESITSSLNRMDSYVSLSTVSITLFEVVKYEPVEDLPITFAERIARASSQSWVAFAEFSQDFAVAIVEALPFLIFLAIIIIFVVIIARRSNKKRKASRQQLNNVINSQNIHNTQNTQNSTVETAEEKPSESEK